MIRFSKPLGVLFLALNLAVAALWLTILHPSSPQAVSKAAPAAPAAPGPSNDGLVVGPMFPPPHSLCFTAIDTSSSPAPAGRPIAQLATIPADFAQSAAAMYPPCAGEVVPVQRPVPRPDVAGQSYDILSVIRYEGSGGTILVSTARPSPAVLSHKLDLGNPAGTLADGTNIFSVAGMTPSNQVRWLQHGLIITLGGEVSMDRLIALAPSVVLKGS